MDCFGTYFTHVQKALLWTWQPAHKMHSGKTAKDRDLTTCTHGAHKIHSCKNKGVHTAKPFRVYRRGPWPRVQMRPPDRVYRRGRYPCDPGQNHPRVLATLAQNHPRVLATPESACTADPLTLWNWVTSLTNWLFGCSKHGLSLNWWMILTQPPFSTSSIREICILWRVASVSCIMKGLFASRKPTSTPSTHKTRPREIQWRVEGKMIECCKQR